MYSLSQVLKGLRRPDLTRRELNRQWQRVRTRLPHDIGVQGSYYTGNIGDRAIGKSFQKRLSASNYRVRLYGKNTEHSAARVRILGGGGVLHDWYGIDHLQSRLNFLSKDGAVIGVGVPGFKTEAARRLVAEELSDVGLVTVRDEWSRSRLKSVYNGKVHTTACPAFLHTDPRIPCSGRTGVNFRPYFDVDSETLSYYFDYGDDVDPKKMKRRYISNIRDICEEVPDPVFIPFHEEDEQFARENLDIDVLPYEFSVKRTLKRVSAVDRMVAMRYHSLVFATICETPTLAIAYEPKVTSLADRLGISSYKPHGDISVEFETTTRRDALREAAERNFDLLGEHLASQ